MTTITIRGDAAVRLLWTLRIACPLGLLAAIVLCLLSVMLGNSILAAINGTIIGINAVLTWVEWRIFQP